MTSEKPQVDYRAAFGEVGTYAITWRKDGKTKKVERWINTADEMVNLLDGWVVRGYDIRTVTFIGA